MCDSVGEGERMLNRRGRWCFPEDDREQDAERKCETALVNSRLGTMGTPSKWLPVFDGEAIYPGIRECVRSARTK
jgi:hypothetical protein